TVLRNYTSGILSDQTKVKKAIGTLGGHHSASTLPTRAMAQMKNKLQWWCWDCRQYVKGSANFCPGCGQDRSYATYTPPQREAPWRTDGWDTGWRTSASPRRRTDQSPRRRQGPKGAGRTGAKGTKGPKGKGQTASQDEAPGKGATGGAESLLAALPRAPQALAINMPQGASSDADRAPAYGELMAALAAAKDELPAGLQSIVQQHMVEDVRLESKGLHRLVNQQSQAKKELQGVKHAREAFLSEWTTYLGSLADLLDKQMEAKAANMAKLDEAEAKWTQQLATASAALSQQANCKVEVETIDVETMEDITNEDAALEAARSVAADRAAQGEDALTSALRAAKTAAEQELGSHRERTPRRKKAGQDEDPAGPTPSRKGPAGRIHELGQTSVHLVGDFVSPHFAAVLGLCLEAEVRMDAQGCLLDVPVFSGHDPRHLWEQDENSIWGGPPDVYADHDPVAESSTYGIERVARTFHSLDVRLGPSIEKDVARAHACESSVNFSFMSPQNDDDILGPPNEPGPHKADSSSPTKEPSSQSQRVRPDDRTATVQEPPGRDEIGALQCTAPSTAYLQRVRPVDCTATVHETMQTMQTASPSSLAHKEPPPQSQRVHPDDRTATVQDPPGRDDIGAPQHNQVMLPGQGRGLPSLRLQIVANIPVSPAELDRPEVRAQAISSFHWATGFRSMGAVTGNEGQYDRYVIFDVESHVQIRRLPRGWSIDQLLADLIGIFPRLRSVHFLQRKLSHLPSVQVSVSTRDFAADGFTLPLDFRPLQGRICSLQVTAGLEPCHPR
ncbi:unnamed protein product, partial [Symbiodinium sp. CCMP2456]